MQRAGRHAMAVRGGYGDNLRPFLRDQRLRARCLDQFHRGGIEQTQRFQKRLLAQRADHQRDMGGADVGGFGNHIGHRQQRAVIVILKLLDLVLAPGHRRVGVNQRVWVDQAKFHRLRHREDLEGGAKLIHPLDRAVEQRAVPRLGRLVDQRVGAVVGIKGRQGRHGDDLAGAHVHQDGGGPLGVQHGHAGAEHLFDGGLHRQIERKLQRRATLGGITQPGIQRLFDPRHADHLGGMHAFGPEGGAAKHMGGQRAVGVKPHLARAEQQAGIADLMHLLHLFGRQDLADPDKTAPIGKAPL